MQNNYGWIRSILLFLTTEHNQYHPVSESDILISIFDDVFSFFSSLLKRGGRNTYVESIISQVTFFIAKNMAGKCQEIWLIYVAR